MRRATVVALLIVVAVPLIAAAAALPAEGSMDNPTYRHVVPRYLEHGAEEGGAENIVTAIILNYRGYDTNGEVTVIFTALVGMFAVLLISKERTPGRRPKRIPASPVVQFIVRVIAPFAFVFSMYVIVNGHVTPGGGFQGGTILGALLIAASLALGSERVQRWLPDKARPLLQPAAVLTFIVIGAVGLTWGYYLAFPNEPTFFWLRTIELLALEAGIGLGGAAIVISLFWTMEEEP